MPPNHLDTRMDAGDAAVSHAPKSPTRRGISDAALRAAKPTSKPYKLFAGNGLYLEVKPNGAKHWRWKYRLLGKENRVALGSYPKLPLREAREAMEAARKLVEQGNGLYESGRFVLLYPKQNHHCESAAKLYQRECISPDPAVSGFQALTLEACLVAYKAVGEEETAQALHSRYLDFSKIEAVIFG